MSAHTQKKLAAAQLKSIKSESDAFSFKSHNCF
jgi:hypothetical protein